MAEGPEPKRRRAEAGDGDGVAAGNGAEAEAGAGAGAGAEPGPGAPFPLSSVRLRRLLRDSAREKAAFVHGQVTGPSGEDTDAVLILEKTPFQEEKIEELLRKHTKLELQMANDIYSTYRLYPPPELSGRAHHVLLRPWMRSRGQTTLAGVPSSTLGLPWHVLALETA